MSDGAHEYIDGCKDKCGACNLCCLAVCRVCSLYEGALTTHCPGKTVSFEDSERIYKGELNYRGGIWLHECSEHTPVWFRRYSIEWQEQHDVHLDNTQPAPYTNGHDEQQQAPPREYDSEHDPTA